MESAKVKIFSIEINELSFQNILDISTEAISLSRKVSIGYINPHILRLLEKNENLKRIFNSFNYLHADGFGLKIASRILLTNKILNPLNWTDSAEKYLQFCSENHYRIFFIGGTTAILENSVGKIKQKYPDIKIVGYLNGYDQLNRNTVSIINQLKPHILWVGLGSPKQEIWLKENSSYLDFNIAQCVGDVFSYLAGERMRGPKLLRDNGFEWLFRLIQHPVKYFNRYVIGIPLFLYLIIKYKSKQTKDFN